MWETTYVPYPVLPVLSRPLNGFGIASRLLPHIRRYDPDVILNYTIYPDGYAAVRIANELGIPVALTAVGSDLNRSSRRCYVACSISAPLCAAPIL